MSQAYRPQRSRFTRLLASVLVIASLVGNGLAMAQAQSAPAQKGCCHEMMGADNTHHNKCNEAGQPCPTPSAGCDVQCQLGSQPVPALLVIAMLLPIAPLGTLALPSPSIDDRALTEPGPGLRPPISA